MEHDYRLQVLDRRLLLSVGTVILEQSGFNGGLLSIRGTKDADLIEIGRDPKFRKQFRVSINGRIFRFELGIARSVSLDAGRGNDRVIDHGGWRSPAAMTLYGGAGDDTIESDSWSSWRISLAGGSGNDKLVGTGDGSFVLQGDDGNDTLYGGDADDFLVGGPGADFMDGGKGRDEWSNGAGRLPGQGNPFSAPVRLSLDRKSNDGAVGENDNVRSVEAIVGSFGADTIDASNADGPILMIGVANRGADYIVGSRFADAIAVWNDHLISPGITVHGGDGNDSIFGDNGADFLYGDDGNDEIDGRGYIVPVGDHIEGGTGNDSIRSGQGDDFLDGGTGNDTIAAIDGHDTIIGLAGNDLVQCIASTYADQVPRLRGVDIRGGSGRDTIVGKSHLDLTTGGPVGFEVIS